MAEGKGLENRKVEQESLTKEGRQKQIQAMRARLNQHVANRTRDAKSMTISQNTKRLMQEKAQQQAKSQEKSREAPAR